MHRTLSATLTRLLLGVTVCSATQAANGVGLMIDNFESGAVNGTMGTYIQTGLPTSDCLSGERLVQISDGNQVTLTPSGYDDSIVFDAAQVGDYVQYNFAPADLTGGGVYDRLHILLNGLTVQNGEQGAIQILASSANGGFSFGTLPLQQTLGWHTVEYSWFYSAVNPLDWSQITELIFSVWEGSMLSIAEIKTGLNPNLKIKYRSAFTSSILGALNFFVDTETAIEISPNSSESTDTTQLALVNAQDDDGDTLQGQVDFDDSGDAADFGHSAGFTLWETTLGAGDTRTVEFEWIYPLGGAFEPQLQPLSSAIQEHPHIVHAPVSVELSDGVGTYGQNDLIFRMEVPEPQPWQIDGIDVAAHPTAEGVHVLILLSKDPSESHLTSEPLLEVSMTGDHHRTSLVAAPPAFTRISMVAQPSIMDASTQIHLSRSLPSAAAIEVVSARGRRVVSLELPAGHTTVEWDGRDVRGVEVGSGVYFVLLRNGAENTSTKVVKLR